jgi:hypothetical protein
MCIFYSPRPEINLLLGTRKLIVVQLVIKCIAIQGIRRFTTVITLSAPLVYILSYMQQVFPELLFYLSYIIT